jgi:hypothetical protein
LITICFMEKPRCNNFFFPSSARTSNFWFTLWRFSELYGTPPAGSWSSDPSCTWQRIQQRRKNSKWKTQVSHTCPS